MVKRLLIILFCLQMLFSVEQVFSLPEYYLLKNDSSCGFASENASDVPTITCPDSITVNNTAGTCGTVVTYSVTATAPVYSSSTIPEYSYVTSSGDRYYFLSNSTVNYSSARSAATSLGGYLVCINSATENALFSSVSSNFWTGATRNASFVWSWADGTDFSSYSNWRSGEPNDEGNESCMEYLAIYDEWNDLNETGILNYIVEMTLSIRQIAGLASGSVFPVGTTTNTFVVNDYWGHADTCSFTVTVVDNQIPSITCASDKTQTNDTGICGAVVTVTGPTTSDNCAVNTVLNNYNGTSNATDTYPVGVTNVVWTVTDTHGNSNTCTQKITVTDDEKPSITCSSDQTQTNDTGICGALVTVTGPTTSDNCAVNTVLNNYNGTSNATDTYPVGVTNVVWTVTDIHGNSNTCTQKITVTDDEYPSIITPPVAREITTSCDPAIITSPAFSTNYVASSYSEFSSSPNNGVVFDNCGVDSVYYQDAITGFYKKTITRTWTFKDAKGHAISCPQTIVLNPPCTGQSLTYQGVTYDMVLVGTGCWTKQNMKNLLYADGTAIPVAKAYYAPDYPDSTANVTTYGRLYSWYSAVNVAEGSTIAPTLTSYGHIQGICPDGWYMPENEHYREIMAYGADALKSEVNWLNGSNGSNSTDFTGLPGGYYNASGNAFYLLLGNGGFWSANYTTSVEGPYCSLEFNCPDFLFRYVFKGNGYSLRCVKECE